MPSNSPIQPLFYYTRILLHPVYINRVHIRNKREYEGNNHTQGTTLFVKNLVGGAPRPFNVCGYPPAPGACCVASGITPTTRQQARQARRARWYPSGDPSGDLFGDRLQVLDQLRTCCGCISFIYDLYMI